MAFRSDRYTGNFQSLEQRAIDREVEAGREPAMQHQSRDWRDIENMYLQYYTGDNYYAGSFGTYRRSASTEYYSVEVSMQDVYNYLRYNTRPYNSIPLVDIYQRLYPYLSDGIQSAAQLKKYLRIRFRFFPDDYVLSHTLRVDDMHSMLTQAMQECIPGQSVFNFDKVVTSPTSPGVTSSTTVDFHFSYSESGNSTVYLRNVSLDTLIQEVEKRLRERNVGWDSVLTFRPALPPLSTLETALGVGIDSWDCLDLITVLKQACSLSKVFADSNPRNLPNFREESYNKSRDAEYGIRTEVSSTTATDTIADILSRAIGNAPEAGPFTVPVMNTTLEVRPHNATTTEIERALHVQGTDAIRTVFPEGFRAMLYNNEDL